MRGSFRFLRSPLPVAISVIASLAGPTLGQDQELPTFLETLEVRVVDVDVVVLDRDGLRVTGLGREDFELFEDGVAVEISNFAAYEEGAPPAPAAPAAPAPAAPGAAAPEPARAPPPATWVVYIDQTRLQPGARNQLAREASEFLARSLGAGDRALVAYFDGLSLKVLSPLSAEPAPTLAALERIQGLAIAPWGLRSREATLRREILSVALDDDNAETLAQQLLTEIQAAAEEEAYRIRGALDAVRDLLAIVAGVEGRVALLLAGGGFAANPAESLFRLWEQRFSFLGLGALAGLRELDARVTQAQRDYQRLLTAVNSSRVTVYTLFSGEGRGLDVSAEVGVSSGASGPLVATGGSLEAGSSLAAFAATTGGRAFVGSPELSELLESARRDFGSYYSLGYHPEHAVSQKLRKIEVRVRREGVRVVHREGVRERSTEEEAGNAALAALLTDAPPPNELGITMAVGAARKPPRGRIPLVSIVVHVPLVGATLLPDGAVHRGRIAFQFSVRDPDGGFRRLEPRELAFDVPNEKLAGALAQVVTYEVDVALEPGSYRVGVSAVDRFGGVRGAASALAEVTAPR